MTANRPLPIVQATAPGKVILVGEHAVVYGHPAIAVPVRQTVATATVTAGTGTPGTGNAPGLTLVAADIDRVWHLDAWPAWVDHALATYAAEDIPEHAPLILVAYRTLRALGYAVSPCAVPPSWQVTLTSQIPIAGGLGSGAALCAALARALWQMAQAETPRLSDPDPEQISQIVFAAEQIYHGTPSGIDNTVVSYDRPVWFRKGAPPQVFTPAAPFILAIADSGTPGSTRATVAHVRQLHQANPARIDAMFAQIANLVQAAKTALEAGAPAKLGAIFDANHAHLQQLEVSTPALDRLVAAARAAGAGGAKLSGGGGGGNLIALVTEQNAQAVARALSAAGAPRVILTRVGPAEGTGE